jgi:uncharacterized protein (DUF58 family)
MRRFLLLGGLVFVMLLAGLATLSSGLVLLSVPLVIYLAAALLYGPEELRLRATRTLSADRVHRGMPVMVKVSITNEGSRLEEVLVEDQVPPPLEPLVGEARVLTSLVPGQTIELEYTIIGQRGLHDFDTLRVTANDYLGLFRRQATISAPAHLSVLPRALKLKRLMIRPRRTRGYAGPVPARLGGSGIDFFGVREYQLGDPQRWINWRVSARHAHALFTNEFEQERIADVGLILDARQRSDVRVGVDSLFEHSVRATAALAETFLSDGNRVGLLVYGRILDWTFPGYGKVQRERILRALARARTGESQVFDNLEYLPTKFFPAQSQIVLVSPLFPDDAPMLIRLRAQGYQVLVVRPDPISFELKGFEPSPTVELAERIARVERVLLLRKLQQAGIQVVDWQVDTAFDRVVHASLGRVPHWFRAVGVEQ